MYKVESCDEMAYISNIVTLYSHIKVSVRARILMLPVELSTGPRCVSGMLLFHRMMETRKITFKRQMVLIFGKISIN